MLSFNRERSGLGLYVTYLWLFWTTLFRWRNMISPENLKLLVILLLIKLSIIQLLNCCLENSQRGTLRAPVGPIWHLTVNLNFRK